MSPFTPVYIGMSVSNAQCQNVTRYTITMPAEDGHAELATRGMGRSSEREVVVVPLSVPVPDHPDGRSAFHTVSKRCVCIVFH